MADFNGDGRPDLVVGSSVLLGNGDGTFGTPLSFLAGGGGPGVAAGDFNGDGRPDLAVANEGSNDVSVLLGNGDGTFGAQARFAVGNLPISVAVGDFNGDGRQDLAVVNQNSNDVSVLLGQGDGTFGPQTRRQRHRVRPRFHHGQERFLHDVGGLRRPGSERHERHGHHGAGDRSGAVLPRPGPQQLRSRYRRDDLGRHADQRPVVSLAIRLGMTSRRQPS